MILEGMEITPSRRSRVGTDINKRRAGKYLIRAKTYIETVL